MMVHRAQKERVVREKVHSEIYKLAIRRGWKKCKKCGEKKEITQFRDLMGCNAKVYHQSYCIPCLSQYQKAYREERRSVSRTP